MNALLVILALLGFVNAQIQVKWSAGADGDWNTAANWDSGVVPNNATVDVLIDTAYTVTLTTPVTVGSVTLTGSSSVLNITANLTTAYVENSGYSTTVIYVGTGGNINALNTSALLWTSYGKVQLNGGAINIPSLITSSTELYVGAKNGTIADLWWEGSGDCYGLAGSGNENLFVTNNFTWTGTGDIRDGCNVHVTKYALFSSSSDKSIYTNGTLSIGADAWLDWKDGRIYMYDNSVLNNWGKITTVNNSVSTSYYGRIGAGGSLYSYSGKFNNWGVLNFTQIYDYVEFYGLFVNQYSGMTGYARYSYCNATFFTGAHSANLTVEHYYGAIILDANYTANGTLTLYSTNLVGTPANSVPVLTVLGSLWHSSFDSWVNIYLPPGTNSTFESGSPTLYKGNNIINNGTYWVFSTSSFTFESNTTFVNWGTFNVAYTSSYIWFNGLTEDNAGSFINVGTMNIKNHFQFRNYFDFLNCGQGQINFEARSYSDYGYIDFTSPRQINIDGDLNILWASQSAADTLTGTSSMDLFQSLPRTGSGALDLPKVNGGNLYGLGSKPTTVLKPVHICFEIGTTGSGDGVARTGILPTTDILDCRPLNPIGLCPKWAGDSKRQSSGMAVVTSAVVALVGLLALLF